MTEIRNDSVPVEIIYGLYAAAYVTGSLAALAGMIYAYVPRGKDPLLDTHLMFRIETFWITLALWILGFVLLLALGLGFIVMAFITVWNAARLIPGS